MMWSKNTNGNLMIGKGKEGKRAEGRGETRKELERTSLRRFGGTTERSRGRSWHGAQSCPVNFLFSGREMPVH